MTDDRLLKAEGAGNDFLIGLGGWAERLRDDAGLVRRLCDRRRGIGADGVLAVTAGDRGEVRVDHRNADGSASAFCANGSRCAALAASAELAAGRRMTLVTGWGRIAAAVAGDGSVTLDLPPPATAPREIVLDASGRSWRGWFVTIGVPHLVVHVDEPATVDVARIGAALRAHPDLGPDGANVDVVSLSVRPELEVRSYERGVEAETGCCGTGVVAAAVVAFASGGPDRISCRCRAGDLLTVERLSPGSHPATRLTGPARLVAAVEPFA